MNKLRFAIIGCGDIAVQEAEGITKSKSAELKLVMDVNKANAEQLAKKYDVDFVTSTAEVFARKDIDAVIISVPHFLHKSITIEAAKAGKHIIIEKPIATNSADALEMIEACKKAKVKLSVAYILRYWPMVAKARELLKKGAIGKVINITIQQVGYKPESYWTQGWTKAVTTDWRTSKAKSGGGVLIMGVSHFIDMLYSITDMEPERVYSEYDTFATKVEVEDMLVATLRYKNGAIGLMQTSSTAFGGGDNLNRIYGSEGQIILGEPLKIYVSKPFEGLEVNKWNDIVLPQMENPWISPRIDYVEAFSDAVLNNKSIPIPGEEGIKAMLVCNATYESGIKHQPVNIKF